MLRILVFVAGCTGSILGGSNGGGTTSGGTTTGGTTTTGGAGGVNSLDQGIRRLTDNEFDNTVEILLGVTTHPASGFASDTRQSGFTTNVDQRVDATLGGQIRAAAEAIGDDIAHNHLDRVVACNQTAADCPSQFVAALATRAFRRPATTDELTALGLVFQTAQTGGTFADGVQAVITAVLQSASFLYIPAIGQGPNATKVLDSYETASALSYFLTAAPPDSTLLDAAAKNQLFMPAQREAQVRRLLGDARAHAQIIRFVKEWLGLDQLNAIDKQPADNFSSLRPMFDSETDGFVEQIVFHGDASLGSLLASDYSDAALSSFYSAMPRRGILSQASFLATHAGRDYSSPVKRGAAILRKVLCNDIPLPTGDLLTKAMMTPPADAAHTTRQRFSQHSSDPSCSGCHNMIDPIGFAFEEYDEVGRFRDHENGFPVDSSGKLVGTDVDGAFNNAAELVARLSQSGQVRRCFARNLFRFASARTSPVAEDSFLGLWEQLPADKQPNLIEVLVRYATSDLFINRSVTQ